MSISFLDVRSETFFQRVSLGAIINMTLFISKLTF